MQPWAKPFYKSKAWRQCRDAFSISRHGICERCGAPGYEVHHKEYLTPINIGDPAVTLAWENLELLCPTCHSKEHNAAPLTADGIAFDADGNVIYTPPGEAVPRTP